MTDLDVELLLRSEFADLEEQLDVLPVGLSQVISDANSIEVVEEKDLVFGLPSRRKAIVGYIGAAAAAAALVVGVISVTHNRQATVEVQPADNSVENSVPNVSPSIEDENQTEAPSNSEGKQSSNSTSSQQELVPESQSGTGLAPEAGASPGPVNSPEVQPDVPAPTPETPGADQVVGNGYVHIKITLSDSTVHFDNEFTLAQWEDRSGERIDLNGQPMGYVSHHYVRSCTMSESFTLSVSQAADGVTTTTVTGCARVPGTTAWAPAQIVTVRDSVGDPMSDQLIYF